jgi:hypothetical protein
VPPPPPPAPPPVIKPPVIGSNNCPIGQHGICDLPINGINSGPPCRCVSYLFVNHGGGQYGAYRAPTARAAYSARIINVAE